MKKYPKKQEKHEIEVEIENSLFKRGIDHCMVKYNFETIDEPDIPHCGLCWIDE